MELFRLKRDIPFMRYARSTIFFSVAFILASIVLLATKGLNLGVDFTGGTVMELGYPAAADIPAIAANAVKLARVWRLEGYTPEVIEEILGLCL